MMSMRNLLPIAGFAAVSAAVAAQVTVSDVRVRADDQFGVDPTESVLTLCSVTPGMTDEQVNIQTAISNDVRELLGTPNYTSVTADLGVDENGDWVVVYTVVRRPQLAAAPAVTGLNGAISERKALDELKLSSNDPIDDTVASAAASRLREAIRSRDYPEATVEYEIRHADAPGYAYVTFLVNPGNERDIRDYLFEGATVFDHDTLAGLFGWRPFWNPIGWFQDYPVTDEKLDDARAVVNGHYVDAGYLDADVATPVIRPIEGADGGRCDVVFPVTEGPLYTIGEITLEGAKTYPAENLLQAARDVLRQRGTVATAATISEIRTALEDYYGSRGYVDTFADMRMRGRSDGTPVVDLDFTLTEGERVTIGRIDIRGNTITQDKVIRRELVIQPGEPYDVRLVKRSESRLQNLNYFLPKDKSGVSSYTVRTAEPGVRDLVFSVREQETGRVGGGVGVSSIDSVFVFASAEQNNFDLFNPSNGFRGGGQRARVGVEFGNRRQTAEASWTQPWLFDMPLSFTADIYRRLRWYDHYDQYNTGAAFTLSWKPEIVTPWGDLQLDRVGVRYTLEKIDYDDASTDVYYYNGKPFSFATEEDGINSKLRFFWNENHRNQPFFTTGGWESDVYAEVGILGDAKDYGFGFNATKWWNPWGGHVIMGRFRFDTVEAYSGDVPMFDRFFIGGGRTIRGFEFRDGGPKAYAHRDGTGSHVAVGGQTLWCGTLEYSIPLLGPLRFVAFTDFGSVGEDFCDFGGDFLMSVGVGLRFDLAGFPIRLDFAKPIVNDDDTEEEGFTFWIGVD